MGKPRFRRQLLWVYTVSKCKAENETTFPTSCFRSVPFSETMHIACHSRKKETLCCCEYKIFREENLNKKKKGSRIAYSSLLIDKKDSAENACHL